MKKIAQTIVILALALILTGSALIAAPAQTSAGPAPVFSPQAQVQADMIFSLGCGVAVSWAISNLKKLKPFKNLHGAGTVIVSVVVSFGITALVLVAEGAFKLPKLILIGAIVAKLANGYYNSAHKPSPATPAGPAA